MLHQTFRFNIMKVMSCITFYFHEPPQRTKKTVSTYIDDFWPLLWQNCWPDLIVPACLHHLMAFGVGEIQATLLQIGAVKKITNDRSALSKLQRFAIIVTSFLAVLVCCMGTEKKVVSKMEAKLKCMGMSITKVPPPLPPPPTPPSHWTIPLKIRTWRKMFNFRFLHEQALSIILICCLDCFRNWNLSNMPNLHCYLQRGVNASRKGFKWSPVGTPRSVNGWESIFAPKIMKIACSRIKH